VKFLKRKPDLCGACGGSLKVTVNATGLTGASGFPCTLCRNSGRGDVYRAVRAALVAPAGPARDAAHAELDALLAAL